MTRPTTISPTTLCDRKIYLQELIDIAPILQPKPRVISLEPKSRRDRIKQEAKKRRLAAEDGKRESGSSANDGSMTTRPPETNGSGAQADNNSPMSPAESEVSFDSSGDSAGTMSVVDSQALSTVTSRSGGLGNGKSRTSSSRTITASIQLQRAGFLRGDNIPLKIIVNHTKRIKSLQGIIVTLYRQARVDMHPALPLATLKGADGKEDYYPKSRTGLGGLSLSSAGSTHVYRKDLSQSFAALIINPESLTAEVKAAVRVPEEAFPTISSVPGAMITFKYYVEVVVDIQGKLSGLDKMIPNSGIMAVPASYGLGQSLNRDEASGSMLAGWGGHFVDTEQIRRDKNVISCVFEVVVGTKDSDRIKGKRRQEASPANGVSHHDPQEINDVRVFEEQAGDVDHAYYQADEYYPYGYEHDGSYYYDPSFEHHCSDAPPNAYPGSHHGLRQNILIPNIAEQEAQLPEKERVRRAEERLLPSRPPQINGSAAAGSSSTQISHAPSAPVLPEDAYIDRALPPLPPSPNELTRSNPQNTAILSPTSLAENKTAAPSAAPDYAHSLQPHPHDSHQAPLVTPTDDKQELQRRRLELERSAPPADSPEDDMPTAGGAAGPSRPEYGSPTASRDFASTAFAPSAPVLDDENTFFETTNHERGLPRYER